MKQCPFCAESIQDAAIKCRYCGSDLKAAGSTRSCPFCSKMIPASARICPSCGDDVSGGASLDSSVPLGATRPGQSGAGSNALGLAAVALGLGAVVMPYFAAVFLVPAAFVCALIALKRGQKGLGIAGIVLAGAGLVSIVYVSGEITRLVQDPFAPSRLTSSEPPVVTLSEYERIREGMAYSEVVAVIGSQGQELSRSDLAGYTTVMYSWSNSNGSNMNAMFQNDRLVNKAQLGLR